MLYVFVRNQAFNMLFNKPKSKQSILTQNAFSAAPKTQKRFKWRWLLLALMLPLFAIFAAFGTSKPSKTPEESLNITQETITEELPLPLVIAPISRNEEFWQIDQVRRDDTLESLFRRMDVRDEDAIKYLSFAPEAREFTNQLKPNHSVEIKTSRDGRLLHLEYELDSENILIVGLTDQGYQIATAKLVLQNHRAHKSAIIRNSLFGATDDAGIPDQIALQVADIFSGDIDFVDDIREGDTFNVIYEAFYNAGELMKTGNVLAVEVIVRGKRHTAIHFGEASGKYAYYTEDGISLHKSFLRSPLEFTRISSTFSSGRFHPILHRFKAHKGVDFAAPQGTRVKAASDGTVEFLGKKGGYGNVVIIKHDNGVSTVYGHLSKFGEGLRKNAKVVQGDIIGYVGMTGMATGPHLHYEFLVGGVHRDPLSVALPTSIPIDDQYKKEFDAFSLDMQTQIQMLKNSRMATKD